MSSQIPPLVCHTPPPIDFDADDDDDDYGSDIPEDDVIGIDDRNGTDCPDDDFGDFATVLPGPTNLDPIPTEAVIDNETVELTSIPVAAGTKSVFPARLGSDSPPSLILPTNEYHEADIDEIAGNGAEDEEDIDFQPFGSPSQPPEPPPEDSISLPSLHFDADVSKSEEDDHVPAQPNATSSTSSGSGIETEVDLPVAAAAERTTPVIQECGRFDDNTENDFTDFTTASNERSSVVLEIPTANDVSFELDDFAQLESTPSADSNFVSQQSRADFATFDADFSKFDSFQASFPATIDDVVPAKTPVEETKSMPIIEPTSVKKLHDLQPPEDEFDDFQEFATFSGQPVATVSTQFMEKADVRNSAENNLESSTSTVENVKRDIDAPLAGSISNAANNTSDVDDDDDDFGEFSDFKQPESTTTEPPICSFSMDNVHKLLEAMFPSIDPEMLSTDTGQQTTALCNIPSNKLHSQLQDFDNTNALAYQHSKSTSSKTLVTALGIDSRNIMYGPKWNSSMPRFAANLSFNPLEPLKPVAPSTVKETGSNTNEKNANITQAAKASSTFVGGLDHLHVNPVPNSSVPAAQFDWNSSGLVNPLEASHAHTLLLDLEQLEVMASLKDKINVDSSSYSPALRSTCNVANTVQLHSATTTATTITTTTPLLLPSSPSPTLPQPLPPLPTPTPPQPPTKLSSSLLLLPTTMNTTQMCNNNIQQPQTKNNCNKSLDTVGTDGGNNTVPLMDCSTTLLVFADSNDDDCDLLISTDPIIPSATVTITTNNTATTPSDELVLIDTPCAFPVGLQSIVPSSHDRPQTFDDYLDLSVQEMLQKAVTGQPEDGTKGEILDPQVTENSSPIAADDIAVKSSSFVTNPATASHPEEYEDIGSLDFTAGSSGGGSNNAQYSVAPQTVHHEPQLEEQLESALSQHYVSSHPQPQPMSISSSPNSVPMVRTIKLPETHIFTPSRGVTPISRDITDRDIVVREYHDVEYSLEKSAATSISSKKEIEFDEFNEFQSVSALPPGLPDTAAAINLVDSVRPVIGRSPTEELEIRSQELIEQTISKTERIENNDDDDDEFSDFQAAVLPISAVPPVNKPVSNVQNNRSNTSSPVMLLSPAILLPQQANTSMEKDSSNARKNASTGAINWPDPGIDPDELARFEAAFAKPSVAAPVAGTSNVASNQSLASAPKAPAVEEDEWSDFISSKPATELAIKLSAASVPSAGSAPTSTETETQEEWTDFISSTAGTVGGYTSHNRLSSSQNNFNYPRASPAVVGGSGTKAANSSWSNQPQLPPPQFSSWNSNSLYYNPMSSLPLTNQQHPSQYAAHQQQQQYYNRSEMPAMVFSGVAGYSGSPKVPTNLQQHHAPMTGTGITSMMMGQQPPMQLLPELSFITPNAGGGHSAGTSGTKPATHSFLSNVISSNSFTKK